MLKRIPKSDISIRPFKAYKEWSFDNTSTEIAVLEAIEGDYTSAAVNEVSGGITSGSSYNKHSLYGQIKNMFYNETEFNPFLSFGDVSLEYNVLESTRDRFLSGSAKVISIPQKYVGEGIKKHSVTLTEDDSKFSDDGYGNILSLSGDTITISRIDNQSNIFNFVDSQLLEYSASLVSPTTIAVNLQEGTLRLVYQSVTYPLINIISYDMNLGVMVVDNIPFLEGAAGQNRIGNIFYSQGLIVITKDIDNLITDSWQLSYKSTQTIYENEYLLIANPDEFNVSQNPSAVSVVGLETTSSIDSDGTIRKVTTNPGVKYIRKLSTLENGETLDYRYTSSVDPTVYAGFEHIDLSGSVDATGSFLAPLVTTIGLYDDDMDLVAVAKLPQPIKTDQNIPINFIVRFDT